jgi:hypothetical protein
MDSDMTQLKVLLDPLLKYYWKREKLLPKFWLLIFRKLLKMFLYPTPIIRKPQRICNALVGDPPSQRHGCGPSGGLYMVARL